MAVVRAFAGAHLPVPNFGANFSANFGRILDELRAKKRQAVLCVPAAINRADFFHPTTGFFSLPLFWDPFGGPFLCPAGGDFLAGEPA